MKIGGDYEFDGPQDLVWETLLDPAVLASVLPGAEKLELVGENEYEGALALKVGPVHGQFQGRVRLEDIQPPRAYTMIVDGRGAPGFVKATGHLSLTAEDGHTHMSYEGDAQVGGRLASVGQRLIESSTKAIIRQSLDGLNAAVQARVASRAGAAEGAAEPVAPPRAPSQARFAANVVRDVARDLIPAPARVALAAAAALGVLFLLYRALRR